MPSKFLSDPDLGPLDCPENIKVANSDDEVGDAYADDEQNRSFGSFFRTACACRIKDNKLGSTFKLKQGLILDNKV